MNPQEEQPTLTKDQIVNYGVKNLLATNTIERNDALTTNEYLNRQLQKEKNTKNAQYFQLMGRIIKYEPSAFEEILPYAFENGCFWECESKELEVYSQIKDYTTKTTNKTYKAHFTIYNKFIQKCKTENEAPISYKGYFLMKNYQDKFELDKSKDEYKTLQDFIKIKSVEPVEPVEPVVSVEPVEPIKIKSVKSVKSVKSAKIKYVETTKFTDGLLLSDWEKNDRYKESLFFQNLLVKKYQNTLYYKSIGKEENLKGIKFLNPRVYDNDINSWNNRNIGIIEEFKNPITKDIINIFKDYDTTPKRKLAKNKIWEVNSKAVNFISAFGYIRCSDV